ncbi:MAG: hypothetical protein PHO28_03745 [Candidatus Pacebacteria bacterium]|nr:hypothetical protein [Candidatus Paceibacterota bacterium]
MRGINKMNNFLKQSEKNWDNLAEEDHLWAILSDSSKKEKNGNYYLY